MATFGLTDSGLLIKRFSDIKLELELSFRSEFGDDVNTDPSTSFVGKIISIFAEREGSLWELGQAVNDSADPDSAEGVNLDSVSQLTGTDRLSATFSTVPVVVTGTPGSFGAAGRIFEVTGSGERFLTDSDATIGGGGTVSVECTAVNSGAVLANAATLTIIVTPVSGWDSITNAVDAELGRPIESNAALRLRRLTDLEVIGAATVEAIRSKIIDEVDGVTDAFVIENDTLLTVGTIPGKAINCTVSGGVDQDILDKIFEVKAAGIQAYGVDITGTVTDSQGISHSIAFDRANPITVWLFIEINANSLFDLGVKQDNLVTVKVYDVLTTYSLTIDGVTVTAIGEGSAAATALELVTEINNTAVNGWVPVNATDNVDGTFNLEADYEGNPFEAIISATTGTGEITQAEVLANSGDAADIISDTIDFANGTGVLPKEQKIGVNVSRSRYYTPINQTLNITSINITTADGSVPTTLPPGGGDWSAADVTIASAEQAIVTASRTVVKVTIV